MSALLSGLHRRVLRLERLVRAGISDLTGDVTGSGPGSTATVIANDAVTNAKLADMAQATLKGRAAGAGTGDPQDLTPNDTSTILDGATDPFLRTSAAGSGGISQLTGDVTAGPGSGSQAATIANDAVTNAKLANMAQATFKMRAAGAGTGDPIDGTADEATTALATASDPFTRLSFIPGGADAFWDGSVRRNADSAGRNSSNTGTTLTDDGVLQFDAVANAAYFFELWLCYYSPSGGGTPDLKFRLTGPATLTGQYTDIFYIGTGDLNGTLGINTVGSTGAVGTATTPRLYRASGWFHSTGGGTGSSGFRLQWAQNNSNANDVIVLSGSLLQFRRAA